eukprot:gnl/MRDRNA2_/MRDRNA2_268445_c0_seq1.p1 gnl/MRDRNA2_/MRDRNA2_268445_c0~~gnl/MRDRNA2_/MRDRNA2_268445_c0_seq1.p1  ORF type:complete len:585 (-),score=86.25 gnl/MRDRNA2_/MRDRNA2_268445_c0_seq1:84-1628(-)
MSTVGFGDIRPEISNERCLVMVMMMFTSAMSGVVINGISHVIAKMSERTQATSEQLKQTTVFMNWYNVPIDLQIRVRQYLERIFESQERLELKKGIQKWMGSSGSLYDELSLAITGKCLLQHRFLQLLPRELLVKVCDICETLFRPPGDVLLYPGQLVSQLKYIHSGNVELGDFGNYLLESTRRSQYPHSASSSTQGADYLSPQRVSSNFDGSGFKNTERIRLTTGNFLGEMRLFVDVPTPADAAAVCISFTEIMSIDVQKFRSLLLSKDRDLLNLMTAHAAAALDEPDVLEKTLADAALDPDDAELESVPLLHECVRSGSTRCISLLLVDLKAEITARDGEGRTALQLASDEKHTRAFEALVQHSTLEGSRLQDAAGRVEDNTRHSGILSGHGQISRESLADESNANKAPKWSLTSSNRPGRLSLSSNGSGTREVYGATGSRDSARDSARRSLTSTDLANIGAPLAPTSQKHFSAGANYSTAAAIMKEVKKLKISRAGAKVQSQAEINRKLRR